MSLDPNIPTSRFRWAHTRWTSTSRRTIVVSLAAFGLVTTGAAAAAGHAPWSSPSRPAFSAADGSNADRTSRDGADGPAIDGSVDGADRSSSPGPSTSSPAADPTSSSPPQPSTTAAGQGAVVSASPGSGQESHDGSATTAPPTTAAPTTAPVTVPPTTSRPRPESTDAPPLTTAAPAPAAPSTTVPATKPDTVVPQTIVLACSWAGDASGNSVSCSWTGGAGPTFHRFLVLRGLVGSNRGRVLVSSSDPAGGSFTDGGLAAGTYSYVVVSLDANDKNTGHSNPIQIVIAPAATTVPPTEPAPTSPATAPTIAPEPAPPATTGDSPTV